MRLAQFRVIHRLSKLMLTPRSKQSYGQTQPCCPISPVTTISTSYLHPIFICPYFTHTLNHIIFTSPIHFRPYLKYIYTLDSRLSLILNTHSVFKTGTLYTQNSHISMFKTCHIYILRVTQYFFTTDRLSRFMSLPSVWP